jgi:hypothetical protein
MTRYDKSLSGYDDFDGKHEPKGTSYRESETRNRALHVCKASARQYGKAQIRMALDEMEEESE